MSDFLSDTNSELYTYRYETGFKSSNLAYIIETHNNNHSDDINDLSNHFFCFIFLN